MCDCMTNVNKSLKEHNTKLATSFVLTKERRGMDCLPLLQVEKLDSRLRGRPMLVIPTFCPFCGVKYPRRGEEGDGLPEAIAS
jgi:hypothetical protein